MSRRGVVSETLALPSVQQAVPSALTAPPSERTALVNTRSDSVPSLVPSLPQPERQTESPVQGATPRTAPANVPENTLSAVQQTVPPTAPVTGLKVQEFKSSSIVRSTPVLPAVQKSGQMAVRPSLGQPIRNSKGFCHSQFPKTLKNPIFLGFIKCLLAKAKSLIFQE